MPEQFRAGDQVRIGQGRTLWRVEKVGEKLLFLAKLDGSYHLNFIVGTKLLTLSHRPTQEELT